MKPDPTKIQKEWRKRGFEGGLWIDPPGKTWEGYVHTTDELLMIIEGKLELEVAGKTLKPAVGEEIFIPAKAKHSVRNIGGTIAKWLYAYNE